MKMFLYYAFLCLVYILGPVICRITESKMINTVCFLKRTAKLCTKVFNSVHVTSDEWVFLFQHALDRIEYYNDLKFAAVIVIKYYLIFCLYFEFLIQLMHSNFLCFLTNFTSSCVFFKFLSLPFKHQSFNSMNIVLILNLFGLCKKCSF